MEKEKFKIAVKNPDNNLRRIERIFDEPIAFSCHPELIEEIRKWRKKVFGTNKRKSILANSSRIRSRKSKIYSFLYKNGDRRLRRHKVDLNSITEKEKDDIKSMIMKSWHNRTNLFLNEDQIQILGLILNESEEKINSLYDEIQDLENKYDVFSGDL